MSQSFPRRVFSPIGFLQIAIILLVVVTALIHLQHGLIMSGGAGGGAGHGGRGPGGFSGAPGQGFSGHRPGAVGTPGQGFSGRPPSGFSGRPSGGSSLLSSLPIPLSVLFILNFIGYIVLVVALYLHPLQRIQRIVRWLLIAFTATTIIAWFLISGSHPDALGVVDKIIEGTIIVLLLIEELSLFKFKSRREPHTPPAGESVLAGSVAGGPEPNASLEALD